MAQATFLADPLCDLPRTETPPTGGFLISRDNYFYWQYKVRLAQCVFTWSSDTQSNLIKMPMPVGGSFELNEGYTTPVYCGFYDALGNYEEAGYACQLTRGKLCNIFVDGNNPNNPDLSGVVDSHNYTASEIKSLWTISGLSEFGSYQFNCSPYFFIDPNGNIYMLMDFSADPQGVYSNNVAGYRYSGYGYLNLPSGTISFPIYYEGYYDEHGDIQQPSVSVNINVISEWDYS